MPVIRCFADAGFFVCRRLRPMIDHTHDRVQTTLNPGPQNGSAPSSPHPREVGRSNIAIGCEMLPRATTGISKTSKLGSAARHRTHPHPCGLAQVRNRPGTYDSRGWTGRSTTVARTEWRSCWKPPTATPSIPEARCVAFGGLPYGDVALAAWDAWVEALAATTKAALRTGPHGTSRTAARRTRPPCSPTITSERLRIIKKHIPDARNRGSGVCWPNVKYAEPYMKILSEIGLSVP